MTAPVDIVIPTIPERGELLTDLLECVAGQTVRPANVTIAIDEHGNGPAVARNAAIAAGSSPWVAFVDDDDLIDPGHIATLVEVTEERDVDVVHTHGRILGRPGWNPQRAEHDLDRLRRGPNYLPVTGLVRRTLLEQVGGFRTGPRYEDHALWRDLLDAGAHFHIDPEVTWTYRFGAWPNRSRTPGHRLPRWVAVPFMDRASDLTAPLVDELLAEPEGADHVLLYDNGSTEPDTLRWLERIGADERVTVITNPPIPDTSLYETWNDAIRRAGANGPAIAVILNNDLTLPRGFVRRLAYALETAEDDIVAVYPDYDHPIGAPHVTGHLEVTSGLWKDGGLSGFAFALRTEPFTNGTIPYIDETLRWYSGDRDLVRNIDAAGYRQARVDGLPVGHKIGASRITRPELRRVARRDVAYCQTKWNP